MQLKLSPRWAGGCGATVCVSVLQGKPKRSGWRGDATSGFLGRRSALFKHALHAVIVRRVAGAQWGERGASMGYGLCGSAALRLSAPWRLGALATRGRGVFVFWIVCLSGSRCGCHARCVCASTPEAYGPTKERDARTPSHCRVAFLSLSLAC